MTPHFQKRTVQASNPVAKGSHLDGIKARLMPIVPGDGLTSPFMPLVSQQMQSRRLRRVWLDAGVWETGSDEEAIASASQPP